MREYYIFGAGLEGVRAEYNLRDSVKIAGFVDNYVRGTSGSSSLPIYTVPEVLNNKENYYLIATGENYYSEIRRQLIGEGLKEFEDFIYWPLFGKRTVYLHGNCHMTVVRDMLHSVAEFNVTYAIYPLTTVQNMTGDIPEEFFEKVDVFISQDIRKENEFGYTLSLDYIKTKLGDKCHLITVPNLFGMGKAFLPQFEWNNKHPIGNDKNGLFPHGDKVINKLLTKGYTLEQIREEVLYGTHFFKDEVLSSFKEVFKSFKKRGNDLDINVYDFVAENYKDIQLFYDQGHPTNAVMKEIVSGILKKLGVKGEIAGYDSIPKMDEHEEFVYPCVSEMLGLNWKQETIRDSRMAKKCASSMDFDEYLKEYVWWKSGERT